MMDALDPESVAAWTGGTWLDGTLPGGIGGFHFDTRQIEPGACFVALGGERDGHAFVGQAARAGAVAALVERPVAAPCPQLLVPDTLEAMAAVAAARRRGFTGPVVGITGSSGKTSTKEMLRRLLGADATHATPGNWNNRIGVPMTLFRLDPATHRSAVIEAGINQPGEMEVLGSMIGADVVLLTNIGPAHLERLGSLEAIAAEKIALARHARARAPVYVPLEACPYPAIAALGERLRPVALAGSETVGENRPVAVYSIESVEDGRTRFQLLPHEGVAVPFVLHSASRGMVSNAALALCVARSLGVDWPMLRERLAAWRPAADRGAVYRAGDRLVYADCYNANPASMRDAMDTFVRLCPEGQARCWVLGAMDELGPQSASMHRAVGEALVLRPQDRACFVGPEPLTAAYAAGALAGGARAAQLRQAEKAAAIESFVAGFDGALFFKGSRSYALEMLLPESSEPPAAC